MEQINTKLDFKRGDKIRFKSYENKNWREGIFKKYIDTSNNSVVKPINSMFLTIATHVEKL